MKHTDTLKRKSMKRHGLTGQNNGTLTKAQRAQSINDKRKHTLTVKFVAPMQSSCIINYRPASIASSAQRKREATMSCKRTVVVGRDTPTNTPVEHLAKDGERLYVRCANGMIVRTPHNRKN